MNDLSSFLSIVVIVGLFAGAALAWQRKWVEALGVLVLAYGVSAAAGVTVSAAAAASVASLLASAATAVLAAVISAVAAQTGANIPVGPLVLFVLGVLVLSMLSRRRGKK